MAFKIPYGIDSSLTLELPEGVLLAANLSSSQPPPVEPLAATRRALAEPLDFPELARATVPGDQIVLALEPGVPAADAVIAAVAGYLVEAGSSADRLTILQSPADAAAGDEPQRLLPDAWRNEVTLEVHAPDASGKLSLLAASREGRPLHMNRTLLDADLVVPIGCLRHESSPSYLGPFGGLFPTFSDTKTIERFRKPPKLEEPGGRLAKLRREVDEVGWLLGTQCTVQILPGPGEGVLDVLVGAIGRVFETGGRRYDAAWNWPVPYRASLVIASLTGRPARQTWENVGRALAAAARAVADGGAIALCTDLAAAPGPAVASLAGADDLAEVWRHLRRHPSADAMAAAELIRASERSRVYLLSRLDESLVEELGLAAVSDASDIARLAHRHESCIVLTDAEFAVPSQGVDESGLA
jgi:nickel-dependent lactate racemase